MDRSPQLFGELLVKNHLVTEDQLARAIEQQHATGQRLGEIFAEWHLLSQQKVQEMLRKQGHLRMAAALVGAILAPLESHAADTTTPAAISASAVDDARLGGVTGGSIHSGAATDSAARDAAGQAIGDLAQRLDPVLDAIERDFTPERPLSPTGPATSAALPDGTLSLTLPLTAGALNVRNVRVEGSNTTMQSIDLRTTVIYVDKKP
ncbi:hypothetical protein ACHMW6_07255 [Pseudoduganella sp. UC29_106]|uniref:hypothetical protein n=1 Tax=Pseudoduganella sp. UC29_106 TaxID=3374553 RepID=UPI0037576BBF